MQLQILCDLCGTQRSDRGGRSIKAYLAGPIFTERDRNFNSYLESEILKRCPDLELYLAQNNASINDKTGCANSADIYVGDVTRLKNSDILITILSGDLPPIGSSYECAYFSALCEADPRRRIIALYDDCREATITYSKAKRDAMISGIAENQFPYINLLTIGFIKKWGNIYSNSADLIEAVKKEYDIGCSKQVCGIYKITNLKDGRIYIGQSSDIYGRWLAWKRNDDDGPLTRDMKEMGMDYFKFEIVEKCEPSELDAKEDSWIEYYDSYNSGYNRQTGGSKSKAGIKNKKCIKVCSYDLDGSFCKEYHSISEAARSTGLRTNGDIYRCAALNDSNHISGGKMWRFYKADMIEPYKKPKGANAKEVHAYDMNTRIYIRSFDSCEEAGETLFGERKPHISDASTGKRMSFGGLLWAYEKFERLPENYHRKKREERESA